MPTNANSDIIIIEEAIELAYNNRQYLDAYNKATEAFGTVTQWPTLRLKLQGCALLEHLGLQRKAAALALHLWRAHPTDPNTLAEAIGTQRLKLSPLEILKKIDAVLEEHPAHAELTATKAKIFSSYRDFATAEQLLSSINPKEDVTWVINAKAQLKIEQDGYAEAEVLVEKVLLGEPNNRAAAQLKAHLLQLEGKIDDAISYLEPLWRSSQSWWLANQIFNLALEAGNYPLGQEALEQLKSLPPYTEKYLADRINNHQADLLCAQEKYDEATAFIDPKNLFHKRIVHAIKNKRDDSKRTLLPVPFIRQKNMTCAPASMSAISHFWQQGVPQNTIIDAICYGGTQAYDERKWASENGWHAQEFDLQFEAAKKLIDRGIPILLATVEPGSAHLQILVGYDESMGTYLLRDPFYPRLQELLITESQEYYKANGPRCLLMLPQQEAHKLANIALPSCELYDAAFTIAQHLEKNQRQQAGESLKKLQTEYPNHRITHKTTLAVAYYDNNDLNALNAIDKLLTLYPTDINFQLQKISILDNLGNSHATEAYIKSLYSINAHFLIKSRYADYLRHDYRCIAETTKIYRNLLSISAKHSATLYGYAGKLWDDQNYHEAYLIYRLVACQDDASDYYAKSYFKAAVFHKDTQNALVFLQDRLTRFGATSSGPARALFDALAMLDREPEGFSILEKAMLQRPNDAALYLYSAEKYLHNGQHKKAKSLLLVAKKIAAPMAYHALLADYYDLTAAPKKAMVTFKKVIAQDPLNFIANSRFMRLAHEHKLTEKATQHIDAQLQKFPSNSMLQRLRIQWMDKKGHQQLCAAYFEFTEAHPKDAWGWRGYAEALINNGQYSQAEEKARQAVDIAPTEPASHAYLGLTLQAQNQYSLAREAFKQAIRLACDYTFAFDKLLSCSHKPEQQQKDLEFILVELLKQVSYGDGILEFYSLAKDHFSSERIQEFMQTAIKERPDLWQSWVGLILILVHQGQLNEAETMAHQACVRFPLLPRISYELAKVLVLQHKDDEAIAQFQHTLLLSPGWAKPAHGLSDILLQQHRIDEAIDLQKNIIKHNPALASPLGYLAELYMYNGQDKLAIEALKNALEKDIDYSFAWHTLHKIRKKTGDTSTLDTLQEAIKNDSKNFNLLYIYCELIDDAQKKINSITAYLKNNSQHIESTNLLINAYVEQGQADKALELTEEHTWPNGWPSSIVVARAKIISDSGNLNGGIKILEELSQRNPQYYNAWRHLTLWYHQKNDVDKLIASAKNCVRLHPHDANILCFSAEKIEHINKEKDLVLEWLKRSFELDMTDQYNALTYIDFAIKNKDFKNAKSALLNLEKFHTNPYTQLRHIDIALALEYTQEACNLLSAMLKNTATDASTGVRHAWNYFRKKGLETLAVKTLEDIMAGHDFVQPSSGKELALFHARTLKLKKLHKKVMTLDLQQDFSHHYIKGYLEHLLENSLTPPANTEKKIRGFCQKNLELRTLCGHIYCQKNQFNRALIYLNGIEKLPNVQGWMLYFYALCIRKSGQIDKAKKLIKTASEIPKDAYYEDIIMWLSFDDAINKKPISHLLVINNTPDDQLSPLSQYVRQLVLALHQLNGRSFQEAYPDITDRLRTAQHKAQELNAMEIVIYLKKTTQKYMREALQPMPFVKRLFWLWRISNHF
jgi:cellulose synthase operon protein C